MFGETALESSSSGQGTAKRKYKWWGILSACGSWKKEGKLLEKVGSLNLE